MVSNERVFHIDQECFIIYAEDLSSKKERFLRIGNTMALKRFGAGLTFLSLITPLFPGDAFREPEIFKPGVDKRIIGLQNVTDRFVKFLRAEGVDTNTVIVSRADGQGHPTGKKITENQFIDQIKDKPKSNKHSFAAFYEDGNVRIFNRSQLMFDLNEKLEHTLDEPKEIHLLSKHYAKFYGDSYTQSGLIYSGRSLFIFSENAFACLTESEDWVRDAVNVGIEPANVSFLYIHDDVKPNSLWLKTFLRRKNGKDRTKIRLVINGTEPNWLNLVSQEVFQPVYPREETVETEIGKLKLFFQNQRIGIYFGNMKLHLHAGKGFLQESAVIAGQYLNKTNKSKFELCLNGQKSDCLCVKSYNPLIFSWDNPARVSDFEMNNPNLDKNSLLFEQHLGFDGQREIVLRNKLLTKKLLPIDKSINPYCFFEDDYDIDEISRKYEEFNNRLGRDYNLDKEQTITVNTRYEKILRDKQFYLDEQKRLWDFIDELDTRQKLKEEAQAKTQVNNDAQIKPDKQPKTHKQTEMPDRSSEVQTKVQPKVQRDTHSVLSEQQTEIQKNIPKEDKPLLDESADENSDDTFNAQELLSGGRFDEYADDVKQMNVGKSYEYNDNESDKILFGGRSGYDERYKSHGKNLWWILIILLLLLLLCFVGFWLAPKYIVHKKNSQADVLRQIEQKYSVGQEQKQIEENSSPIENDSPDIDYIPANEPIHSVKTSFYYKFRMTVLDQIELTNAIAKANGYDQMGQNKGKKYDLKDPHWIYPGNIITMPDGSNITVESGDNLWSLCNDFLIDEINGYELEIRNILQAAKTKNISVSDAKTQFRRIKDETHSQMVRDFMEALLVQSDFSGWESDLVINDKNDMKK